MNMKAQASAETIVITATVFLVFAIMMSVTISKQLEGSRIKDAMEKGDACDALANEVESVFAMGNGTKSSIKMEYNATVSGRTVIIDGAVCNLCCGLEKNSSETYMIPSGILKIENKNGNITLVGPRLDSAARYSKPSHTFVSDETDDVNKADGTFVTVDKDNRVLHIAFDTSLDNNRITAFVRCRNDDVIQLKNESLGTVISSAPCVDDTWMWINLTASGRIFDINTDSRDVDYDFIGII